MCARGTQGWQTFPIVIPESVKLHNVSQYLKTYLRNKKWRKAIMPFAFNEIRKTSYKILRKGCSPSQPHVVVKITGCSCESLPTVKRKLPFFTFWG